jgi:hypothetical protein
VLSFKHPKVLSKLFTKSSVLVCVTVEQPRWSFGPFLAGIKFLNQLGQVSANKGSELFDGAVSGVKLVLGD